MAMGDAAERKRFLTQVSKACRIARRLRELDVRPHGVVRIDSACSVAAWREDPKGNQRRIAETFREACKVAEDHDERLAAEGEICWGGMHSWRRMIELLEMVDRRQTLGFQADMAHTLLYLLGYNAPEDALLPQDFDWQDQSPVRRSLRYARHGVAAVDDRFPRRPKRRDGPRRRLARQNRPALPGHRSERQARHRPPRRLLAARRRRTVDQKHPPHLLGRLHVPQRRDDEAANVERHSRGDAGRTRCARVERIECRMAKSQ